MSLDIFSANNLVIGIDSEGSPEHPYSVQISTKAGTGYMIKANDYSAISQLYSWILSHHPLISLHYSIHDLEMFEKAWGWDVEANTFTYIDTMVLAYVLCVEPQSLKNLAFRLAGMKMSEYGEIIGDVGYSIALDYLCRVAGAEDAPLIELPSAPVKVPRKTKKNPNPIAIIPQPVFARAWPDPDPVIEQNGNGIHIRKAQGVTKLVSRILTDIGNGKTLKSGETTDPRDRWHKLDDKAKAPVIAVIGDMPSPTLADIPADRAIVYGSRDADSQFRITPILLNQVKAMGLEECARMDMDCLPAIYRMQKVGIQLAPSAFWDEIEKDCQAQMNTAQYKIFQATGKEINPNSGDQVATLLYDPVDKGGLGLTPPAYTEGGEDREDSRGSTSDKCLQDLLAVSPIVEWVADYREAAKVLGTYVEPLRLLSQTDDGRVHPNWKYTRTYTGRFATTDPNVLAIPIRSELGERCRHGFVAPEGMILYDSDLGQIEARTFAHLSADPKLCQIFIDGAKLCGDEKKLKDIHTITAAEMFSCSIPNVSAAQRQAAKAVIFGVINGITEIGLTTQMIVSHAVRDDGLRWTTDDCFTMIQEWFKIYPKARQFQLNCIAEARATGLTRDPLSGRIRYIPQIWAPKKQVVEEAERISYAHQVQTSANTILRRAMKAIWDALKNEPGVNMVAVVHDEVLEELPDKEDMRGLVETVIHWALTSTTKLRVPIEAEGNFGPDWGSAH